MTAVEGKKLAVETDNGRTVRLDTEAFKEFGLGYAGTVYRGQGKTQTQVQALYDNAFSWNARTAYVGMTRHKADRETLRADQPGAGRAGARSADEQADARRGQPRLCDGGRSGGFDGGARAAGAGERRCGPPNHAGER